MSMPKQSSSAFTRGTTLIELMLYLAISTGIIVGVGVTSLNVLEQREKARSIDTVRYAEALVFDIISEDIRAASGITIPALPDEASTTLQLRFVDPARNPTIIEVTEGKLYRTVATGTRVQMLPNSVNLSNAFFTHIEGLMAHPSVLLTGILSTGDSTVVGNAYSASRSIETAATLRAPLP